MTVAIIIVVALIAVLAAVSYYFFRVSVVRGKAVPLPIEESNIWGPYKERMLDAQRWIRENTKEMVEITSFDGLKLKGIYIENPEARGTMVVMHGYRSLANVDFAPEAEFLYGLGYNLILPFQRSHGESEGKYITYGFYERHDCKAWAQYADEKLNGKGDIFLAGISMGCATVVMASGLELPSSVRGIIADCGYTSPWEIMAYVAKRDYHLPAFPILYITNLISRVVAGFDFKGVSTIEALKTNRRPILFIHGGKDDFVPCYMSERNFEACTVDKELLIVPNAAHAQAFLADSEECMWRIREFVQLNERR